MWGVVKGFQIACNFAGPLGDLTGKGDQSSRKVVHRDLAGPLGDLTGTDDQPSGKVVLLIRCRTRQGDNQHRIRATREDGGVLNLVKRVSLKSTLHEISVKLDKRNPTVLRNIFTQAEPGNRLYDFFSQEV